MSVLYFSLNNQGQQGAGLIYFWIMNNNSTLAYPFHGKGLIGWRFIVCFVDNILFKEKNAAKQSRQHARIHRRSSSMEWCLPWKVVFIKGHLPPKVVFHRRSSSAKCCLPPRVSATECRLPQKAVLHQRLYSTKICLPPRVVFNQRSFSTKSCLPSTIIPWLIVYLWEQSAYQISASYITYKLPLHQRLSSSKGRLPPTITP